MKNVTEIVRRERTSVNNNSTVNVSTGDYKTIIARHKYRVHSKNLRKREKDING